MIVEVVKNLNYSDMSYIAEHIYALFDISSESIAQKIVKYICITWGYKLTLNVILL